MDVDRVGGPNAGFGDGNFMFDTLFLIVVFERYRKFENNPAYAHY